MLHKNPIRFLVTAIALLLTIGYTRSSSTAAPSAASSYLGQEIVISERDSNEYSPDIAFNTNHDEYLVVWENVWPSGFHDVYAQRVSGDGRLLNWFSVASSPNQQMNPSVAYDHLHDRYLVVWAYDALGTGTDWDIYGRFIPWEGPDAGPGDFVICNWNSDQRRPVVAYGRAQDEFLVTWTNAPSGQPTYISARRVYADGSGFPANPFLVSSGPENRDYQDVAYNLVRNEYLVTWDVRKSGTDLDIWGVRLSATGSALSGGDPSTVGEFAIAGWPAAEERPAVASCAGKDQYLVAWQSDKDTGGADSAIYARYLSGDAVPGNVYLVDDTTSPEINVDIGSNATGQSYILAWQSRYTNLKYGVIGSVSYPNETIGPAFVIMPPVPAQDRNHPTVGGGYSNSLVAWEHQRNGGTNYDIHGRFLGYTVYLPLVEK
jgi:hypothetical protein